VGIPGANISNIDAAHHHGCRGSWLLGGNKNFGQREYLGNLICFLGGGRDWNRRKYHCRYDKPQKSGSYIQGGNMTLHPVKAD
jgi:hypothetical protein